MNLYGRGTLLCAVALVIGCAQSPLYRKDVWRNYDASHDIPSASSPYKTYVSPGLDNDSNYSKPRLPISGFGACVSSDLKNFSCE